MRKKSSISSTEEASIDLTPMLDVVFIMLIFFIVTSSFVKESGAEILKPKTETAEFQKRASLLVAVTANNEIWINKAMVSRGEILDAITKQHAENPKGSMVIQADREADSEFVLAVLDAARDADVGQIAFAADNGL
jgi:biopolymer transport protein ExbD